MRPCGMFEAIPECCQRSENRKLAALRRGETPLQLVSASLGHLFLYLDSESSLSFFAAITQLRLLALRLVPVSGW